MGLYSKLFRQLRPKRSKVTSSRAEMRVNVEVAAEKRPYGSASAFATPVRAVEAALDQILADVDMPKDSKIGLRSLFVKAHRSGDPRREVEAIEAALDGIEWGEEYFGAWKERFLSDGEFPYAWRVHGKGLVVDPPRPAYTIEDAVGYLRVADMRKILIDLDAMPKRGRPKRRSEFVELLLATGKTPEVIAATIPAYDDAHSKWEDDREAAKCALLAHTLTMRAYSLRDSKTREGLPRTWQLKALSSDCPVEAEYAARFMAGKIGGAPPFFPGDRTSLIAEFADMK